MKQPKRRKASVAFASVLTEREEGLLNGDLDGDKE